MNYSQFYKLRLPEGHDYYDVEDFNSNTQTIDGELNKLKNMIGHGANEHIVTIPANGWTNSSYTINLEDVTSESIVIMGIAMNASSTQLDAILGAKINSTSLGSGTVTIKAFGTVPSIDIPLSFVVM